MNDFKKIINKRNEIVPQMIDYDKVGDRYVPYVMRFDKPHRNFKSVSTDEYGFRQTVKKNKDVLTFDEFKNLDLQKGVIIGGSTVFGVGATNDCFTIPSYLNKMTSTYWYNFGARAYNSTQELLLFLLHAPETVKNVVLFSGINNVILAYISKSTSPIYNSLFYQSQYEAKFENLNPLGIKETSSNLLRAIKSKLISKKIHTAGKALNKDLNHQKYNDMINCFKRDIQILKSFCNGNNTNLFFAMQPLATWINKNLSQEERELFKILDNDGGWPVLADNLNTVKNKYFTDIENICSDLKVNYYNLNQDKSFVEKHWLFVDRVHLTDLGYDLSAKILKREFGL